MVWSLGMWDQKLVYDFSKGAWLTFRELGKRMETVKLELPREFPLWREDGAGRFDARNGSKWFQDDLKAAGQPPQTLPGAVAP